MYDSHCHLDFTEFDADRCNVWQRAQATGLLGLLIPGVHPDQWPKAREIALALPNCHTSAGLHPHWIKRLKLNTHLELELSHELDRKPCIAIGECGIDRHIDVSLTQQQTIFGQHLKAAYDYSKPLIIHHRQSHALILEAIKKVRPSSGGVIHAFSGSLEIAKEYIKLGFKLGVGGVVTYPRANKTRAAVADIGLEHFLLETDAPYMPLYGEQGQRNEPSNVANIAQHIASLTNTSANDVTRITNENYRQTFYVPTQDTLNTQSE